MRYILVFLLAFAPCLALSQRIDTIQLKSNSSQLYSSMSVNGLRNLSLENPPTTGNRDNFPVGVVLANSRATFYIWRNTCPSESEDSVYMHIGLRGCWERSTNAFLTASWCLVREGDDFRIDMQCLWDSLQAYYPIATEIEALQNKIKADSTYSANQYQTKQAATVQPASGITDSDIQHWRTIYNTWTNVDTSQLVFRNRTYNNPSFIDSLPVSKVINAASKNYVDAGVTAVKNYADFTFQTKGNYRTSAQTLTLSGRTLGITDGNTVILPTFDTTPIYNAIATKDPSSSNELQSLSISGNSLSISSGNTITVDGSTTNELQTLSISGTTLSLSSGNSISIPQTTTLPYSAITSPPTIPTLTSQLTNNSGYLTAAPPTNIGSSIIGNTVTLTSSTGTGSSFNVPVYTAGTGISISGNVVTNTAPASTPVFNNSPARSIVTGTGATGFQISATRPAFMSYSVTHAIALTLVLTSGSSMVFLEISPNNAAPWTAISSAGYSDGVSVAVAITKTTTNNVQGMIPAGWYTRLRSVTSTAATATFANGQEVTN